MNRGRVRALVLALAVATPVLVAGAAQSAIIPCSTEFVQGTDQADVIDCRGATGPVVVEGGGGNDVILGSRFDDNLDGGTGRDVILAGAGDDLLSGPRGDGAADFLDGGPGTDFCGVGALDPLVIVPPDNDVLRNCEPTPVPDPL